MARLVNPRTGSVVVVPDEKAEVFALNFGYTTEGGKAPAKKATAKKAPAKRSSSKSK